MAGYIVYDKVLSKNVDNDKEKTVSNNEDEITKEFKAEDYIVLEDVSFNDKVSTKKVKLNNLDDSLTKDFYQEQEEVIKSIHVSDSDVFNAEYDLKYFLNNNILSVLYSIKETNEIGTCATKMAVANIDLENNKVISEEELLKKVNTSYNNIVDKYYNNELKNWEDRQNVDYYGVTFGDFKNNKSKYIDLGLEKISDVIYTYIENNQVKYDYYEINVDSLFHQVGKGGCFNWKTEVLGDL